MGRISNTIELAKASWRVLQADKELLVLPLISLIATIVVIVSFIAPLLASGVLEEEELQAADYVVLFVMYVVLAFVTIFFNSALVHAADQRLRGGDPTLGTALSGAVRRVGRILPWAVVSATVSIVLRAIEERFGALGQLVAGFAGLAWALVTYLVIPILVIEDIGVVDAVKRSGALFKRTWGENVAAQFGFGLLGFLAILPVIPIVAVGTALGQAGFFLGLVIAVLWIVGVSLVLTTLNGIFQTALYHYAVDGQVPGEHFSQQMFTTAFAPRDRRRGWLSG